MALVESSNWSARNMHRGEQVSTQEPFSLRVRLLGVALADLDEISAEPSLEGANDLAHSSLLHSEQLREFVCGRHRHMDGVREILLATVELQFLAGSHRSDLVRLHGAQNHRLHARDERRARRIVAMLRVQQRHEEHWSGARGQASHWSERRWLLKMMRWRCIGRKCGRAARTRSHAEGTSTTERRKLLLLLWLRSKSASCTAAERLRLQWIGEAR